jgi:hypothetical protein
VRVQEILRAEFGWQDSGVAQVQERPGDKALGDRTGQAPTATAPNFTGAYSACRAPTTRIAFQRATGYNQSHED